VSRARDVVGRNLRRAIREGRLEDAASLLERLRREAPLEVQTRGLELEYLLAAGRLDEARALADQLILDFPASARIFFLAGRTAYARREYGKALERFEEAGRLAPHWRVRYWTGKTLTQLGRLDEAEPVLLGLVEEHPFVAPALAWLYERRGAVEEAIAVLRPYLNDHPGDRFAAAQLERLEARALGPERLSEEVETLLELGEEIPPPLLAGHVEALLQAGRGPEVRELMASVRGGLEPRVALQIAWICHRNGMPDLACSLFLEQLPSRPGDVKLQAALEKDARLAGRMDRLLDVYRELAPQNPRLWGRIRRLTSRLE